MRYGGKGKKTGVGEGTCSKCQLAKGDDEVALISFDHLNIELAPTQQCVTARLA